MLDEMSMALEGIEGKRNASINGIATPRIRILSGVDRSGKYRRGLSLVRASRRGPARRQCQQGPADKAHGRHTARVESDQLEGVVLQEVARLRERARRVGIRSVRN